MSSPSPIPNDRRNSRASSNASLVGSLSDPDVIVGGPPSTPSPLALRAINSPYLRRSRPSRAPMDMTLLDYVSTPDSNLTCLICQCPFDDPVRLTCEHYFCRECLDRALEAQPHNVPNTCPTCRQTVEQWLPVPKIIADMLDELQVRCPNAKAGCAWVDHRVDVANHVARYCQYALVDCPDARCNGKVMQKDAYKACLHVETPCPQCQEPVMKINLEEHQRESCSNRTVNCPQCRSQVLSVYFDNHVNNECPQTVVKCKGQDLGCKHSVIRDEMMPHEKTCPMATMMPFFEEQQTRLERAETRLDHQSRKLTILEDGLSNITTMLYPPAPTTTSDRDRDRDRDRIFPSAPGSPTDSTHEFRLPSAAFPPVSSFPPFPPVPSSSSDAPPAPFDSSLHHILSLHENLRDEVARLTSALSEHEAHTNMMVMVESQRQKDELKHQNMAISQMRAQLHWLVSATLQQQRSANAAGSSAASGSGSRGQGAAGRTGPAAGGSGGATAVLGAVRRRLSDSTRQDTKL